jgi:hypothetical protein
VAKTEDMAFTADIMIISKEEARRGAVQEKIVNYEPMCGVIARQLLDANDVTVIRLIFGNSGCTSFETEGTFANF